jgi:hypothetical protein
LTLSFEEIDQLSNSMERESKAIKDEIYRLCWYMRGSISLTEAYNLSIEDIEVLNKIVKDNLETTKKTQMPFF